MDISIRKNEHCIIGLPRCDYVFSSTRSCFIGYGFKQSPMEVGLLTRILEDLGIQTEEAGGNIKPAQSAFCAKICSKIITSQFCIALINNDEKDGLEIPNANVNMEYGLMLGFNKYVIPFQKESQRLPFNVAGLDTIKYSNSNFEAKALEVIKEAVAKTTQDNSRIREIDQILGTFLLTKEVVIADIEDHGEKNIYRLGAPFGFNLLNDFSGLKYFYFGNFTQFRREIILWRLQKLLKMLSERKNSLPKRAELGISDERALEQAQLFFEHCEIWLAVTNSEDKLWLQNALQRAPGIVPIEIFTIDDIREEGEKLRKLVTGNDYF